MPPASRAMQVQPTPNATKTSVLRPMNPTRKSKCHPYLRRKGLALEVLPRLHHARCQPQ